jgi:FkbM family methyltransferase
VVAAGHAGGLDADIREGRGAGRVGGAGLIDTTLLKTVRNLAATAGAWALYQMPPLEAPYAYAAHAARRVPGIHTFFRETTDRLVDRLTRAHRADRNVRIGGLTARFDVSSFTVKGQYFAHMPYEPGATGLVLGALGAGDIFVDVGANSGYFTVLAALRVGDGGRVFAFEPNPATRRQLEHHVAINGVAGRVSISDVALAGADQDEGRLFVSRWRDNDGIASLTPAPETVARGGLHPDHAIAVRVRTFDTWMRSAALPRIDLMKIDVEGAEAQVLAGMADTLSRVPPRRIICETPVASEAVATLTRRGYRMSMLDEIPGGIPNLCFERS